MVSMLISTLLCAVTSLFCACLVSVRSLHRIGHRYQHTAACLFVQMLLVVRRDLLLRPNICSSAFGGVSSRNSGRMKQTNTLRSILTKTIQVIRNDRAGAIGAYLRRFSTCPPTIRKLRTHAACNPAPKPLAFWPPPHLHHGAAQEGIHHSAEPTKSSRIPRCP